jgi:hypothetical protein
LGELMNSVYETGSMTSKASPDANNPLPKPRLPDKARLEMMNKIGDEHGTIPAPKINLESIAWQEMVAIAHTAFRNQ